MTVDATGSAGKQSPVIKASHFGKIPLDMALQAKVSIVFRQKLILNRPVRVVAGFAALPKGLVLPDKRAPLFLMTVKTEVTGFHKTGRQDSGFVDALARGAVHSSFGNRVMIRKIKGGLDIKMALVARFSLGTDDIFPQIRSFLTRLFHVDAPRSMTHLTDPFLFRLPFGNEPPMLGLVELGSNLIVARFA